MNREILFRGKRADNGEWVESKTVIVTMENEVYIPERVGAEFLADLDEHENILAMQGTFLAKIDPSTVGQYTGLKDRNGKRIFEGDVVEFPDARGNHRFRIFWADGNASYFAEHAGGKLQWSPCCNRGTMATCTVVGNIHDNPGAALKEE